MDTNLTLFENALLEAILNNDFDLNQLSTLSFFDVVERTGKLPTELTEEETFEYASMVATNLANAIEDIEDIDMGEWNGVPVVLDTSILNGSFLDEVELEIIPIEDLPEELWETDEYLSFGEALVALQEGKKIKRKHWLGYWFIGGFEVDDYNGALNNDFECDDFADDVILARLANGSIAMATPYQADLLSYDWEIL